MMHCTVGHVSSGSGAHPTGGGRQLNLNLALLDDFIISGGAWPRSRR